MYLVLKRNDFVIQLDTIEKVALIKILNRRFINQRALIQSNGKFEDKKVINFASWMVKFVSFNLLWKQVDIW